MQASRLAELISRQRSGWSLEQPFYVSEDIYKFERSGWLAGQWYILAHSSELRQPGYYLVRELLGESLLLVRDEQGNARGFYNVCRHRGSRICSQDGHRKVFVCPYHGWTYRLDGSLRSAAALPIAIDQTTLGLHSIPVREFGGVIWGSLKGEVHALDAVQEAFEPGLRYYGIPSARIAARRRYSIEGNWKLVLENFFECYHCFPAHPEYCSVMKWVDWTAREPADGGVGWKEIVHKWFAEEADPDSPLKETGHALPEDILFGTSRMPIGNGRKTQSQDGNPVAPLMGQQRRFDGGVCGFFVRPFASVSALNDHGMMFQITPTGVGDTEVVLTWLVDGATSDAEIDVPRMIWLWDVTTSQDKALIERNAAGVRSRSYVPGPYSTVERVTAQFVKRYLMEQSALSEAMYSETMQVP
jgi:phenylpropionate dioxygenase-like ring-hydroxylating dioxygenase large terminal subunit